ncbi:MAG TPA: hypothetical protein VHA09_06725 [Nitrososphaera sp.]|nr:hypothetical protein [Nitrososphaera sp.]
MNKMATIYTELFQKECENKFGMTREVVRDAIAQPDREQRLESQGLTLILYSKKLPGSDDRLIVSTHVQEQHLLVDLAFRLKKEMVDQAKTTLPFPLLQALALRFGLPVKIGDRESKFVYNEILPTTSQDIKKVLRIGNPENKQLVSSIWVRMLQNRMGFLAQCALVFCLDSQAYQAWLEKT